MRSALKSIFALRPDWEVCGEAADGHETIANACHLKPDLIILDFKMPLADGLRPRAKSVKECLAFR
jgi:DNA-binding NarL/FixJ family response regulator